MDIGEIFACPATSVDLFKAIEWDAFICLKRAISFHRVEPATSLDVESQDDTDARHTGMERLEKVPWTKLYEGDAILTGKFGTLEEPTIVHSWFPSRIVGCQGSAEHPHDILWHEVRRGRDTVCLECGQVFRLRPNLFHQLSEVEADLFPPTEAKESASH
jgi:hypothetical protein